MSVSADNSSVEPSRHGPSTIMPASTGTKHESTPAYTAPTVFICVPQGDLKTDEEPECRFWMGPLLPQSSKRNLEKYTWQCQKTARDTIQQYSKSRKGITQDLIEDVQSSLNSINPTSEGFKAIAVDSSTFLPSCAKFNYAMDNKRFKTRPSGILVLSEERLPLPMRSTSRFQKPINKVADFLNVTANQNVVTDCKVYSNRSQEHPEVDGNEEYHDVGSRLIASLKEEGFLTEKMLTDILKEYPTCRSIRLPRPFADLPIFEKVNSGKTFDERASTTATLNGDDRWDNSKYSSDSNEEGPLAGKFTGKDDPDRSESKMAAISEVLSDKENYW